MTEKKCITTQMHAPKTYLTAELAINVPIEAAYQLLSSREITSDCGHFFVNQARASCKWKFQISLCKMNTTKLKAKSDNLELGRITVSN